MATIKDIANRLGISPGTVSKGLNGASDISETMRDAVLTTAIEMGYKPKSLQNNLKKSVCIMVENMNYVDIDQFGYEIITGFEQAAILRGFSVTVIPTNLNMQSEEQYDSFMMKNKYQGAFLLGFGLHDDYVKQLDHTTVPTALFDNFIPKNPNVGYVGTDNAEGIEHIIAHLKELGHTKLAFLNGTKNSMITQKRQEAFVHSMAHHGLTIYDGLVGYGDYNFDCAKDFVPDFLEKGATAIMCASDFIASGVLRELGLRNLRVPEDLVVTGYDDLPIAKYLSPTLTTVRQNRRALGRSAFLLLDALMNGMAISRIELRPEFIIRESTMGRKV